MGEKDILLGKKITLGGRNHTNTIPLEISTTSKPLVRKDIKETVDLLEIYREEYSKCHDYRITLTLHPYCTNVLYNVCTEIVKDEGSSTCNVVSDSNGTSFASNDVYGKTTNVKRAYMVSNTEYSSPDIDYTYYPGNDIFDNHTLRNLSFRQVIGVNDGLLNNDPDIRKVFNTTADYLRTKDGKVITFFPRFSINDVENNKKMAMHIYEHANLLSFIDGSSEQANLYVDNGWYGFKNASSIDSNLQILHSSNQVGLLEREHDFSHTINNVENCDFIQMFPDKTRYSFIPHYNTFRKRFEKNWDVFLTYPWKNFYNHNLVMNVKVYNSSETGDGNTKALLVFRLLRTQLSNNRKTMLFRGFCKHGLSVNDKVVIYFSRNYGKTYKKLPKEYTVDYLGNIDGSNKEYFFGISSKNLVNDLFEGFIESSFYNTYTGAIPLNHVEVSSQINDVPDNYSDEIIQIFKYVQTSNPSSYPYTSENTFDAIPKTINQLSPQEIRVWNNNYEYMEWDVVEETYIAKETPNEQTAYSQNNTFTDVPNTHLMNCIRIKQYNYYIKNSNNYFKMKNMDVDEYINEKFATGEFCVRFAKIVNGVECEYYIRQFRKVPNFKFSSEQLSLDVATNNAAFLRFVENNATEDDGTMTLFDSDTYRLAFSKTIYGDDVAQVTFLDNVNIENLVDNLGRPLTEIYATVVKRNKGYKEWYVHEDYQVPNYGSEDIEYSRCFGSLISGLEYLDLDDDFDVNENTWNMKRFMSSVSSIYRSGGKNSTLSLEEWDTTDEETEITEANNVFFGDVVEYNRVKCQETVLSDVCFRFNTAQREVGQEASNQDFNFTYHTLQYDDYDPADPSEGRTQPFRVVECRQWGVTQEEIDSENNPSTLLVEKGEPTTIIRHEGYFYKPHTRIPLLRFGNKVFQASHRTLQVKKCEPLQADGMYIKVTTTTRHGLGGGTVMFVAQGDEWVSTTIAYVIDGYSFAMNTIKKSDSERNGTPYIDWVSLCVGVSDGSIKLRVKNSDIPLYATRIDENIFVWREVVNPGDLPENDDYKFPFSNQSFYVDCAVNLYLRRQDPDGLNGLHYYGNENGNIPDIDGEMLKTPNNEYKTEKEFVC